MVQLSASDAQSDLLSGQPGSKAEASKQQAKLALPVAVSVAASATAAALQITGSSPVSIVPILPRVCCSTDVVRQSVPGTAVPVVDAKHSPDSQQHISPAGCDDGSPSNRVPTSPQQHAISPTPSAPSSAASPRSRHAHFASTLPARFGKVAHTSGAHGVVTPASAAASTRHAAAGSRKRRSSPGHLEACPQSAPLGPAMAAGAVSRAPPLAAATMPLPQR